MKPNILRDAAKERGERSYDPEKPCVRGHVSHRSVATNMCLMCGNENARKCYTAGPLHPLREQAKAIGDETYSTGEPCSQGHIAARYTTSGRCVECHTINGTKTFRKRKESDPDWAQQREQKAAQWKKNNPDKVRTQQAKWRKANPDKVSVNNKNWRKRHPEQAKANCDKWRHNNREKARESVRDWAARNPERAKEVKRASQTNRRSREMVNGGCVTGADILALFERFDSRCAKCGDTERIEIDHIMPVARGGTNSPSNLQLLCKPCNRSKSDKDPIEWALKHGLSLGYPFSET